MILANKPRDESFDTCKEIYRNDENDINIYLIVKRGGKDRPLNIGFNNELLKDVYEKLPIVTEVDTCKIKKKRIVTVVYFLLLLLFVLFTSVVCSKLNISILNLFPIFIINIINQLSIVITNFMYNYVFSC